MCTTLWWAELSLSAARPLHLLQGTAPQSHAFGMSQEAYLPEREEDLLSWIQDAYCNGQPKLIKDKGKLSGMEAKHTLKDLQVDVRCAPTGLILLCCSQGRYAQVACTLEGEHLLATMQKHGA